MSGEEGLRSIVQKVMEKVQQGVPIKQLDTIHYMKFEGVNQQVVATESPLDSEDTLALYMVDLETKKVKRFIVTASLSELVARQVSLVAYGTTDTKTGKQFKVAIQWENEVRL